jgi:signal transduction histidine kinase
MAWKLNVYPEYPPRVRVEWLIASTRVVLAAGALLAIALGAFGVAADWILAYSFGWYLAYAVVVLALVWTPVRFARGWDVALHLFDLSAFSLFMVFAEGTASPFFVYFIFLVICGTLRWELKGAVWTAIGAIAVFGAASAYGANVLHVPSFTLEVFIIRAVHLAVVAVLLGYLGAYQHRFQREIDRLVSWPRKLPRIPRDVFAEIVAQSAEILESPRVLLVWDDPDTGDVNLAWGAGGAVTIASEPEGTYASLVVPGLEHRSFQAAEAGDEHGRVIQWSDGSFRHRYCRPVHTSLLTRFNMDAVQSWPLDGELVRGRLFALDKPHLRIDDLVFGEVVVRLAASRLDSVYLFRRLRKSAAFEERLRVARDLHDSLLQLVAGSALQLLVARRLLARDPSAAREQLEEVQNQLEHSELEMRSFIRRLRPATTREAPTPLPELRERLEELRRRVERQWEVKTRIRPNDQTGAIPEPLADEIYRIVQEGVLNAARHADASLISVDVVVDGNRVDIHIVDDGHGFPFHGTFTLNALNSMNEGPLTLRERVGELRGELTLDTSETGTDLRITVPLEQALHG